jgi:hypothetical protein
MSRYKRGGTETLDLQRPAELKREAVLETAWR